MEISSRFASGEYKGAKLYGIIKEVAPVIGTAGKKGAATDKELGVGSFQTKYFKDNPVYMDTEKVFYNYLGDKSLLSQPLHSWNPFQLYSDYNKLKERLDKKQVTGNMNGEGLLKGGFLIITPTEGVVYRHEETTGSEMPYDEIGEALSKLDTAVASASSTAADASSASSEGEAAAQTVFTFDKKADPAPKDL